MVTVTTPEGISAARKLTLHKALYLEVLGLRRHGRSAYAIVKSEFGLKGSKPVVFAAFEGILRKEGILK
jgi:hypothetical protein